MIGNTLKRMRTIYGYKAIEMSKKLNISTSYLSEIENNKKQPSLELLQKYANIFGLKLSSLILLYENLDETNDKENVQKIMKRAMEKLVVLFSDNEVDKNEPSNEKV